ncbi:MAG TPA: hypothetical protein VJG66_02340 [Patescibacteria group bacterium]|nr:hypothetical protein [Patescibacteria group bacterium]
MAKLISIDGKDFIEIKFHRVENMDGGYRWIVSNLHFGHNGIKIVNSIGTYFDVGEIQILISDINNLLLEKISEIKSSFLEPNLELKMTKIEKLEYKIDILFREFIGYKSGIIKNSDESKKKMQFIANHTSLASFTKEFETELQFLTET